MGPDNPNVMTIKEIIDSLIENIEDPQKLLEGANNIRDLVYQQMKRRDLPIEKARNYPIHCPSYENFKADRWNLLVIAKGKLEVDKIIPTFREDKSDLCIKKINAYFMKNVTDRIRFNMQCKITDSPSQRALIIVKCFE
jgi:hypothetical protein